MSARVRGPERYAERLLRRERKPTDPSAMPVAAVLHIDGRTEIAFRCVHGTFAVPVTRRLAVLIKRWREYPLDVLGDKLSALLTRVLNSHHDAFGLDPDEDPDTIELLNLPGAPR